MDIMPDNDNLLLDNVFFLFEKFHEKFTESRVYIDKLNIEKIKNIDILFLNSFIELSLICDKRILKIPRRSKILKMCNLTDGSLNYNKLWESCNKWKRLTITIHDYQESNMVASILDMVEYNKTSKELILTFNSFFYKIINYSKNIILERFFKKKKFIRPVTLRLFELVESDILRENQCKYEVFDLAKNLGIKKQFISQIKQKIIPAIKEINRKTHLNVCLESIKVEEKNIFLFFNKIEKGKTKKMKKISFNKILEKHDGSPENLMSLFQDTQKHFGYISFKHMELICDYVGIPLSRGYSVATFYQSFKLEPQGEHDIKICLGTACHLKASQRIMDELEKKLKVKPGITTTDMKFTYSSVNCVGACALAPVAVIDEKYHPNMSVKKINKKLKEIDK